MANRLRGEVEAVLDGQTYTLCLTLGALAELEAELGVPDLGALAARLGRGPMRASELAAVIRAGLRGGGHALDRAKVAAMRIEGGAAGFAALAADLVSAAFGGVEQDPGGGRPEPNPPVPQAERTC